MVPHPRLFAPALALSIALAFAAASSAQDAPHPTPGAAANPEPRKEAAFIAENDAAMATMMNDMTVKPTGDVDRDFVAMMVPHHQGAIDMALALLRHGHNEQLKRLAQEIIVTQQQEIAAMRLAVGEPLPPSAAAPTQPQAEPMATHPSMSQDSMPAGMRMK
jgi:uncharacterized protein (DUF305 family)